MVFKLQQHTYGSWYSGRRCAACRVWHVQVEAFSAVQPPAQLKLADQPDAWRWEKTSNPVRTTPYIINHSQASIHLTHIISQNAKTHVEDQAASLTAGKDFQSIAYSCVLRSESQSNVKIFIERDPMWDPATVKGNIAKNLNYVYTAIKWQFLKQIKSLAWRWYNEKKLKSVKWKFDVNTFILNILLKPTVLCNMSNGINNSWPV